MGKLGVQNNVPVLWVLFKVPAGLTQSVLWKKIRLFGGTVNCGDRESGQNRDKKTGLKHELRSQFPSRLSRLWVFFSSVASRSGDSASWEKDLAWPACSEPRFLLEDVPLRAGVSPRDGVTKEPSEGGAQKPRAGLTVQLLENGCSHELQEAVGVEVGPVHRDRVLKRNKQSQS